MKPSRETPGPFLRPGDEDILRQCLARAAPDLFGDGSAIEEIRPTRFDLVTSYDAYRLSVRLAGGREVQLFLKDFSACLRRKNDPKERREREVAVYRDLLADAGLGTARYFGSLMDESQGRLWMMLEYVDGTPVGYGPLGDGWAPAAEGLGRMHGHFAGLRDRLRDCEFLITHDAEFFLTAAERALANVKQIAPQQAGRLEPLVRGYAPIVAAMTSPVPTLVQGGCRSSNILIQVAADPERVCILDWEEASLGSPLFDVAHLLDGIEPPLLDRLLEAYRRGAAERGLAMPPLDEMKHDVECFRLHMAFNSLSRAVFKGYKESDVLKLLDYADPIGRAVYGPARAPASVSPASAEENGFESTLERWVSKAEGREVEVTGSRREPSPVAVAGVFPIEVLYVSLRGGEDVPLFVKHLGQEQADHPDKQCRDRERRLYEEWLGEGGLPVPRYYGSRRNQRTERNELYLEFVGDWSLKYQSLDSWFAVAPHLAAFHARFAERAAELRACDYLLRLDAAYFRAWAERALEVVADRSAEMAAALAPVVHGYGPFAEALETQPATLVHNDLAPKNVLADRAHQPPRICFVDWEMAGVGCGLLDLVHLKHGLDSASDRAMCDAYCAELEGTGLLPSDPRALRRLFAACELHHTLYRLAHSHQWRLPPERVSRWVRDARDLAGDLQAERAS